MLYFNSNKPHSFVVFFCRIRVVLENRRSFQGGVRTPCTLPLDPPLLLQTKITKSSLQVSKQVNAPPVDFVFVFFFGKFVNSINFAQEMRILPQFPQTSPLTSSTLLQRSVTVVGVQFFCYWFVTLFVNLLCETCKFSSTFSVNQGSGILH